MLTKIRLRNFKAFKDTGDIEIAPLTVLTGPNSSGKSAIIRAMMALRQTTESRDPNTAFVPVGDYVDLGRYEDFVFKHDTKSAVGFDVGLRLSSPLKIYESGMPSAQDPSGMSTSLDLSCIPSTGRIYLAQSTVRVGDGFLEVHKDTKKGSQIGRSYRTLVKVHGLPVSLSDSPAAKFYAGPLFQVKDITTKVTGERRESELVAARAAKMLEDSVIHEFAQLHYIGPLQASPQRMYLSVGDMPRDVGTAGEAGPAMLMSASRVKQLNLKERLSKWCSKMGLACEVKLVAVSGGFFQVLVVDPHTKVVINLPDAGFGTSRILPILVQGLTAIPGSTLMLEQPEIYLHPKVQAHLADFLIEAVQRGVGVVMETHSEHLITRLQRRIAEEALNSDDVALYFVTPSPEGSNLERVAIDEYGQIPNAPKGFFEEGFEEAFALARAVGGRKSARSQSGNND